MYHGIIAGIIKRVFIGLTVYGKKETPDAKGMVKVNLTDMQNSSMKELGFLFNPDDVNGLIEKKITSDKISGDGCLLLNYNIAEVESLSIYWEIISATKKITRD